MEGHRLPQMAMAMARKVPEQHGSPIRGHTVEVLPLPYRKEQAAGSSGAAALMVFSIISLRYEAGGSTVCTAFCRRRYGPKFPGSETAQAEAARVVKERGVHTSGRRKN